MSIKVDLIDREALLERLSHISVRNVRGQYVEVVGELLNLIQEVIEDAPLTFVFGTKGCSIRG